MPLADKAGTHCSVCGLQLTEAEATPATGHTWGEGVVTTQPTTGAEGVMTYTCTACGATKTEPIAKLEQATDPDPVEVDDDETVEQQASVSFTFECINTAANEGRGEQAPYTVEVVGMDIYVYSASEAIPLENVEFVGTMADLQLAKDELDASRIVFVACGTRYAFSIDEILSACTGASYTVAYENGAAVLRGATGGVLYGRQL